MLKSKLPMSFRMMLALALFTMLLAACTPAADTTTEPEVEETDEVEVTEEPEVEETDEATAEATDEATGEATDEATQEAGGEASGTLEILAFNGETGDDIATNRVAFFRNLYPDVELAFTEGGLDEQQFLTAVASGTPPDLVYVNRDFVGTYASRGALMPLTTCIDEHGLDMSQYYESAVSQVTLDGTTYGVPEFYNFTVVIANEAALDEAGLTMEDLDTSDWDAIAAANDALTRVEDGQVTRIGFDPKLPEFLPLWAMANGVELISADGRTAQLNSPEVVEALEFAHSLHEAAGGREDFLAFRDTWDFFGAGNQYAADQLGAMPMEQWYANVIASNSPDAAVAFAPFLDREGNPISYATGNAWAIPTGADNVAAACEWMKTVTSVDAWADASQKRADARAEAGTIYTGTYSGNRAADEVIFGEILQPTGNESFDAGLEVILSVMDIAFSIPANPAGQEFNDAWRAAVAAYMNGEMSAQEALDIAQEQAQAALDEAWSQQE